MLTINQLSIQKHTLNNQGLPPYTDYQAVTSFSKLKRYIKSGLGAALGAEENMRNGHFNLPTFRFIAANKSILLHYFLHLISITPKRDLRCASTLANYRIDLLPVTRFLYLH